MKFNPSPLGSLANQTSAIALINGNFTAIQALIEDTISKSGLGANQMNADLDMNSRRIYNLPEAGSDFEPVIKQTYDTGLGTIANAANTILTNIQSINNLAAQAAVSAANAAASAAAATVSAANNPTVKSYGALGNGTTNDRPAFIANDAANNGIIIPNGSYLISSSLTINNDVTFRANSSLIIPNGVTVTFNGYVQAPISQIFQLSGTGNVVFNVAKNIVGYPEWWGAVINNGAVDCSSAINASIVALPITQLQAADYWITNTVLLKTGRRRLRGLSPRFSAPSEGTTRIVVNSASIDGINMGVPGSVINNFSQEVVLESIHILRSVPVVAPPAGSEASGAKGVVVTGALWCTLYHVVSSESYIGFYINGTCQLHVDDCTATRNVSASNSGTVTDKFFGYFINGNANIGAAGGNASTYFTRPVANCTNINMTSYAFFLVGTFVDTYIYSPEGASTTYGMYFLGVNSTGTTAQKQSGNADVTVVSPVMDTFGLYGYVFEQISAWGAISILGGYGAPGQSGALASILVLNSIGAVSFVNFQHVGFPVPSCQAMIISNSMNVSSLNGMFIESSGSTLDGASLCRLHDLYKNPAFASGRPAVQLKNASTRNHLANIVSGAANVWTAGTELIGTTPGFNEINCTLINPGAITTANSSPKLVINGAAVTTAGLSGTNLASGVMN